MTEFKITLEDGTEFEAPNAYKCLGMALGYENESGKTGVELAIEDTLEEKANNIVRGMKRQTPHK